MHHIYIYQLCVPLSENVKLQFVQKDKFLFKTSYISVCSKTYAQDCVQGLFKTVH